MGDSFNVQAYDLAQRGLVLLKSAVVRLLAERPEGLKNSQIGHLLGINADFMKGQQGWIPFTLLRMLEQERMVVQLGKRGKWVLAPGARRAGIEEGDEEGEESGPER